MRKRIRLFNKPRIILQHQIFLIFTANLKKWHSSKKVSFNNTLSKILTKLEDGLEPTSIDYTVETEDMPFDKNHKWIKNLRKKSIKQKAYKYTKTKSNSKIPAQITFKDLIYNKEDHSYFC